MNPQTIKAFIKSARTFLDVLESETERKTPDPEPPTTSKTIEQTPANDEVETESKPRRRTRKATTTNKPKISEPEINEETDEPEAVEVTWKTVRDKMKIVASKCGKLVAQNILKEYNVTKYSELTPEDVIEVNQTVDKLLADIEANEAA